MDLFGLPNITKVNKVIPKNAFDNYTTTKQKKLFAECVLRITWTNKLSPDTINLEAKEIKEIQLFKVELKAKQEIQTILDIIDRTIPYTIIFVIEYNSMVYLSTSSKHSHPTNEDNSVIDWTFKTDWFKPNEKNYKIQLKKSIDDLYLDFCIQLSGHSAMSTKPLHELIAFKSKVANLEKEISQLKFSIITSKQFNNKVALNLKLKQLEKDLKELKSNRFDVI